MLHINLYPNLLHHLNLLVLLLVLVQDFVLHHQLHHLNLL
jgi:hypothetical protein